MWASRVAGYQKPALLCHIYSVVWCRLPNCTTCIPLCCYGQLRWYNIACLLLLLLPVSPVSGFSTELHESGWECEHWTACRTNQDKLVLEKLITLHAHQTKKHHSNEAGYWSLILLTTQINLLTFTPMLPIAAILIVFTCMLWAYTVQFMFM